MIVTLTSKGQLTLPKAIREQMKLDAGSKLDFSVTEDGTLTARPMRSASSLFGILHKPGRKAVSIDDMDRAIAGHLDAEHRRVLGDIPERTIQALKTSKTVKAAKA